jgi:U1 small nuclear ribonucleoprotein C
VISFLSIQLNMPKFYCDYCDIYLAHSSIGGRRQHCIGRKHIQNKIDYYQRIVREQGLAMMPILPGGIPPVFPGMHAPFPGTATFPGGAHPQIPPPLAPFMPQFNFPFGVPPPPPPGFDLTMRLGYTPSNIPPPQSSSRFNK